MVSDNLKWRNHILVGDQAIVKQLRSRVNALSMLSSRGDFKTKLMTANGIVISRICYLIIQLWGGCEGYLLHALQVQLNKAARLVTGQSGFTSTRKLMETCRWLSVKQLVVYQSAIMIHKSILIDSNLFTCTAGLVWRTAMGQGSRLVVASDWTRPSGTGDLGTVFE